MQRSPEGTGEGPGVACGCQGPIQRAGVETAGAPGPPGIEGHRADRGRNRSSTEASRLKHLPNVISAIRGLLVIPIVSYTVSAGSEIPVLALVVLALAWITDGLDGWLARRLDAQSELGRILDPVADKIVVDGTALALWMTGRIPGWLALAIVARDVGILALGIPMRGRAGSVPRANPVGKVAMVVLVITLGAYLLRLEQITVVLKWVALAALVVSAGSYGYRFLAMMRRGGPDKDRDLKENTLDGTRLSG